MFVTYVFLRISCSSTDLQVEGGKVLTRFHNVCGPTDDRSLPVPFKDRRVVALRFWNGLNRVYFIVNMRFNLCQADY